MNEKLKPCPFCGSEEIMMNCGSLRPMRTPESCWCLCSECRATSGVFESKQKAAEAWNRRAEK